MKYHISWEMLRCVVKRSSHASLNHIKIKVETITKNATFTKTNLHLSKYHIHIKATLLWNISGEKYEIWITSLLRYDYVIYCELPHYLHSGEWPMYTKCTSKPMYIFSKYLYFRHRYANGKWTLYGVGGKERWSNTANLPFANYFVSLFCLLILFAFNAMWLREIHIES